MRVDALCPVSSCSHNVSLSGCGRCPICKAFLIAKPSPRRKTMDLRGKGVCWMWKPDPLGADVITTRHAEFDPEGMTRTVIRSERGRWVQIANGIIRLHPDFRRVGIDPLPFLRNVRWEG